LCGNGDKEGCVAGAEREEEEEDGGGSGVNSYSS
jgi:hypothetical protein